MAAAVPTIEPDRLLAGDTWRWDRSFADYLASDGWTLSYSFRGPGKLDVDATTNGAGWSITVAATKTVLPEGTYVWSARVSLSGEVHTVAEGTVYVAPSLLNTQAIERQLWAEATLPKVEAVLFKRADDSILEYEIAGRKLKHYSFDELWKFRAWLRTEVARKRTKGRSGQMAVRFG